MNEIQLGFAEWDKWKELCRLLKQSGAVTTGDLNSPLTANNTPGLKLLSAIRDWGDAVADLREHQLRQEQQPQKN